MPWLLRMATHIYPIDPSPKVRMTRKDTWRNSEVRPAVQRWRAFQNRVQELGITVRDGDHITFRISMPESWSAKKKAAHIGTPHRSKPDLDNLLGGLFDAALLSQKGGDQHIAEVGRLRKIWSDVGRVEIWRDTEKESPIG
jgi:Holliday junction resolvase RusA-like endonuclease